MEKIAVIDVGSNSVRLMLVANGKVLYKTLNTTRLGEGIAFSPYLKNEAIERTALAVRAFCEQARQEGANKFFAFATAAVRSAKNGSAFVDRVKELCDLTVEVLSGETEAEIGIAGALKGKNGGLIDIGGASTEIIVQKQGKIVYEKSVNVGVVRLKDLCGRDRALLENTLKETLKEYGSFPTDVEFHAIGGTATTLGALKENLEKYDGAKVSGVKITSEEMQTLTDKLFALSVDDIKKLPCVEEKRADVIAGGALAFLEIMKTFSIASVTVSDSDNLEGYALKQGVLRG